MGFTIINRKRGVSIRATGSDANALFKAMCQSVEKQKVQVVCAGCDTLLPESDHLKNHCQPCADALKGLYK
ncbi:hypothetical protein [Rhodoferax sp.]|uniref:hypothetical protein n=1 Tax=Rhodoferax sp. TaxID=50421 RepID=UPI0025E671CD|nr:hypothetical protein [Rhodoferax sp.]